MKFRKPKKKSKDDKNWKNSIGKEKKRRRRNV